MEFNLPCYSLEKIYYTDGFLKDSVDATYVIHLENNGRLEHVYRQLSEYHPTDTVYILHNKGYKKCHKELEEQKPCYDLIDSFLTIFRDAKQKNYNNILVLEDDFFFNHEIVKKETTESINAFLSSKQTESFIYYLGCVPYLTVPSTGDHKRILLSTATHACIYSKEMREICLSVKSPTHDWDYYTNMNYKRYMYRNPLCFQVFEETENYKNWYHGYGVTSLLKAFLKYNGMDKKETVEQGFRNSYIIADWMFVFVTILIVLIVYTLYSLFLEKKENK